MSLSRRLAAMAALVALSRPADSLAQECVPACRSEYVCVKGQCVSACNPPCGSGEVCRQGECAAVSASAAPAPAPASTSAVAAVPFASVAAPSGARRHDGFYLQMALGLGNHVFFEKVHAPGVETTQNIRGYVVDGHVLVGGTVVPGLVVGGGLQFMVIPRGKKGSAEYTYEVPICSPTGGSGTTCSPVQQASGETQKAAAMITVGPFVDYYPFPTGGLHFQGVLGYSTYSYPDDVTNQGNGFTGPGFTLGAGYEFWVAEQWSLGVMGQLQFVSLSASDRPSSVDKDDGGVVALSALATVTYH